MRNMRNFGKFKRTLKAGIRRTDEQVVEFHMMHAWALLEELQHRTPKLSGLLASSWRSSKNGPSDELPTKIVYETLSQFKAKMKGLKVGDSIHLTNNQPYGRRIEYGYGVKNPPTGFVRPSLRTYRKRLRKI